MHKFMRFVRQNKKKIIKVALIVAFLFGCLQLLNYVAKSNENQIEIKSNNKSDIKNETNGAIVSDKSALSGGSVSTTEIKKVSSKIEEFVGYCNEHDVEKAYDMLSDSCKEELYPSQEYFEENYYNQVFEKGKKTYSIENWTGNTYIVKFKGDLLATGKSSDGFTYQDYITIDEKEKKLNINKYGIEMFKAGTSLEGMSVSDILNLDSKTFKNNDITFTVSQAFTLDILEILNDKDKYLDEIDNIMNDSKVDAYVFVITDIIKNGSYLLYNKECEESIRKAFNLKKVSEGVFVKDVVSRKKQIVPVLIDSLEK